MKPIEDSLIRELLKTANLASSIFCVLLQGVNHHLVGESAPPKISYTIKDDVVYSIDIEEYRDGKWVPYNGKYIPLTLRFLLLIKE